MGVLRNFGDALRYRTFQIIQARNFAGAQAGPGLKNLKSLYDLAGLVRLI